MTDDAAHRLMRMAGQDLDALRRASASRDFQPVKLNLKASVDIKSEVKRVEAPNVAAVIPGRDPKLRDEYVI
ncbi:MAG: aminopeptidase, partial [Acidobacteria bacterium]|nr:aminopeptidase [Acidobacteriota bacterium]